MDVGYDRAIEIDEKKGRGTKTQIKGIKLVPVDFDIDYADIEYSPQNPRKRSRESDQHSEFFDPNKKRY
ncbi:MAG: hypothetical protein R3232_01605, partial [Clostridia bacterium]|nr:hypothetical protein [Clostridia bacterium]